MLIGERRRKIIELVNKEGSITVDKLSKMFRLSKITIRMDLQALEDSGKVVRTHGGALKILADVNDLPIAVKETKKREEKFRIGKAAANLINNRETIILDSGTTTMEIAKQIPYRNFQSLTVITNALNIAMELAHYQQIQVIMLGGTLRSMSYSMVGPIAEETLDEFYADKLFLGVDGFDIDFGLSTPDILEARLNRKMIEVAESVILVADSSKFGYKSSSYIVKTELIDTVITDSKIEKSQVKRLQEYGVEVLVT